MITVSPFTGGKVVLHKEQDELTYRSEQFVYTSYEYECVDTHQRFTDAELDWKNLEQIYSQYRERHGIPSPAEIRALREHYGLSASKMSEILGLGANQYRLYEDGEMPSEAIGKMLRSVQTPAVFLGYVQNCKNEFSEQDYAKLCRKIEKTIIGDIKSKPNLQWFFDLFSFGGGAGKVAL